MVLAPLLRGSFSTHMPTSDIRTSGEDVLRPVVSFAHFGFDEPLMNTVRFELCSSRTQILTPIQ